MNFHASFEAEGAELQSPIKIARVFKFLSIQDSLNVEERLAPFAEESVDFRHSEL